MITILVLTASKGSSTFEFYFGEYFQSIRILFKHNIPLVSDNFVCYIYKLLFRITVMHVLVPSTSLQLSKLLFGQLFCKLSFLELVVPNQVLTKCGPDNLFANCCSVNFFCKLSVLELVVPNQVLTKWVLDNLFANCCLVNFSCKLSVLELVLPDQVLTKSRSRHPFCKVCKLTFLQLFDPDFFAIFCSRQLFLKLLFQKKRFCKLGNLLF